MTGLDFLLLAFAAFRISRLIIEDTITQPFRDFLFHRWPGEDIEYEPKDQGLVRGGTVPIGDKIYATEPTWIGDRLSKLLSCYACTGFWVSLALAVGFDLWPAPIRWISIPFALSGAVWLIAVAQERLDEDS